MGEFLNLAVLALLAGVGYFAGSRIEKRHYRSIEQREEELESLATTSLKSCFNPADVEEVRLVSGICVISNDYFKMIYASLKNIFGGRLTMYESLIDRARREATLRMKEQGRGFDMIVNCRLETSSIGGESAASVVSVEAIAYGTALKFKKSTVR